VGNARKGKEARSEEGQTQSAYCWDFKPWKTGARKREAAAIVNQGVVEGEAIGEERRKTTVHELVKLPPQS